MPLFSEPRVLFIHIPKNAGRSIERTMMDTGGDPDWGRPNLLNRMARALTVASRSDHAFSHLVGTQDIVVAAQHLTYAEIELLGLASGELGAIPSFCVCRNPYDRAISSVTHFFGAVGGPADFERVLDAWLDQPLTDHNMRAHRRPQYEFILDSRGRPTMQHVLRYERLAEDFKGFAAAIGRAGLELPWAGRSERSRDCADYYTPYARRRVAEAFGEDLDYFRYGFAA
jgi:hypothetical protein